MTLDITVGTPLIDGLYIVYVDGLSPEWKNPYLVMWYRGEWFHRFSSAKYIDQVRGWIGPLPLMQNQKAVTEFDL